MGVKVPDQVIRSVNALIDCVSELMMLHIQKVCQSGQPPNQAITAVVQASLMQ